MDSMRQRLDPMGSGFWALFWFSAMLSITDSCDSLRIIILRKFWTPHLLHKTAHRKFVPRNFHITIAMPAISDTTCCIINAYCKSVSLLVLLSIDIRDGAHGVHLHLWLIWLLSFLQVNISQHYTVLLFAIHILFQRRATHFGKMRNTFR